MKYHFIKVLSFLSCLSVASESLAASDDEMICEGGSSTSVLTKRLSTEVPADQNLEPGYKRRKVGEDALTSNPIEMLRFAKQSPELLKQSPEKYNQFIEMIFNGVLEVNLKKYGLLPELDEFKSLTTFSRQDRMKALILMDYKNSEVYELIMSMPYKNQLHCLEVKALKQYFNPTESQVHDSSSRFTALQFINKLVDLGSDYAKILLFFAYENELSCGAEHEQIVPMLEELAKRNDILALHNLGYLYSGLASAKKDSAKSMGYLTKSSELGCIGSFNLLGHLYQEQKNFKKAFECFTKAYHQGSKDAAMNLYQCHYNGLGVEANVDNALQCLLEVNDSEYPEIDFLIGEHYWINPHYENRIEKAVKYLNRAAKNKHMLAQYQMASFYFNGSVSEQDNTMAFHWMEKAAGNNFILAIFALGEFYKNGIGVEVNHTQAAVHFHRAAVMGHDDAKYQLSLLYKDGHGVEQDMAKATYWYLESKSEILSGILSRLTPRPQAPSSDEKPQMNAQSFERFTELKAMAHYYEGVFGLSELKGTVHIPFVKDLLWEVGEAFGILSKFQSILSKPTVMISNIDINQVGFSYDETNILIGRYELNQTVYWTLGHEYNVLVRKALRIIDDNTLATKIAQIPQLLQAMGHVEMAAGVKDQLLELSSGLTELKQQSARQISLCEGYRNYLFKKDRAAIFNNLGAGI